MIATGLSMSPGMNAAMPWLPELFGGRQSARSVHFIASLLLLGFFFVHMMMVLLAGPLNEVRSIITGWYRLPVAKEIAE
jgi:thiosulfate reductase cytochrome b subunit